MSDMKEEALRLAQILEDVNLAIHPHRLSCADMIRKLVAKIEVTERDYSFMYNYAKGLEQVEKELKAELDKQGEPVAWFDPNYECRVEDEPFSFVKTVFHTDPLYTAPQIKPRLSDKEIMQISHKALEESGMTKQTNFMVTFARAIEERHGIK